MKNDLQQRLIDLITASLKELKMDAFERGELFLDSPQDARFGDLSCNIALRLAREAKRPSRDIANELLEAIRRKSLRTPPASTSMISR